MAMWFFHKKGFFIELKCLFYAKIYATVSHFKYLQSYSVIRLGIESPSIVKFARNVALHSFPNMTSGMNASSTIIFDIMIKIICPDNGSHYDYNKPCNTFHACERIALN